MVRPGSRRSRVSDGAPPTPALDRLLAGDQRSSAPIGRWRRAGSSSSSKRSTPAASWRRVRVGPEHDRDRAAARRARRGQRARARARPRLGGAHPAAARRRGSRASTRESCSMPRCAPIRLPSRAASWYDARCARRAAARSRPAAGRRPAGGDRAAERALALPGAPLLAERLAPGASVILDDADRAGERWMIERWERELGVRFERPHRGARRTGVCSGRLTERT